MFRIPRIRIRIFRVAKRKQKILEWLANRAAGALAAATGDAVLREAEAHPAAAVVQEVEVDAVDAEEWVPKGVRESLSYVFPPANQC